MLRTGIALFCLVALSGCGFPTFKLSAIEKQADIEWLFGVFQRNYAPAQWKEAKHGVSLARAKEDCVRGAESLEGGDVFIAHLASCAARFKDAHVSMLAGGLVLPETAEVAFLGFQTELVRADAANPPTDKNKEKDKKKDPVQNPEPRIVYALRVTKLLPTSKPDAIPVAEGDMIIAINDQPVETYLLASLGAGNDLGHDAASLFVQARIFPLRVSYQHQMPKEDNIAITLLKAPKSVRVELPWSRRDLLEFSNEQQRASAVAEAPKAAASAYFVGSEFVDEFFRLGSQYRNEPGNRANLLLSSSFRVFRYHPALSFLERLEASGTANTAAPALPFDAVVTGPLSDLTKGPFPARLVMLDDGTRIGYVRVSSFSLSDDADVKLFQEIMAAFNKFKAKGVILDLLDNGGGSLTAGLRMINTLTPKAVNYPSMQFGLNDNWIGSFRGEAVWGRSDALKTRAARVAKILKEDLDRGQRISRPFSTTELDSIALTADKANCVEEGKCLNGDVKLVLLVNEMCASMCDIFASSFRDNAMGQIVGSQTMGAGGNVVTHGVAPITQVMISQTESLIVDVNGQYLENQGVQPTVPMDTVLDRGNKYSATYTKALELAK